MEGCGSPPFDYFSRCRSELKYASSSSRSAALTVSWIISNAMNPPQAVMNSASWCVSGLPSFLSASATIARCQFLTVASEFMAVARGRALVGGRAGNSKVMNKFFRRSR
jgi:hypothetical protein